MTHEPGARVSLNPRAGGDVARENIRTTVTGFTCQRIRRTLSPASSSSNSSQSSSKLPPAQHCRGGTCVVRSRWSSPMGGIRRNVGASAAARRSGSRQPDAVHRVCSWRSANAVWLAAPLDLVGAGSMAPAHAQDAVCAELKIETKQKPRSRGRPSTRPRGLACSSLCPMAPG